MFILKRSRNWQYYWILISENGKIICQSENYSNKQSAINAILTCQELTKTVQLIDESPNH